MADWEKTVGINLHDLHDCVILPALQAIGLYSLQGAILLAGTYLVEGLSADEAHLRQVRGPALGLWQEEEQTYHDCWDSFLDFRPELAAKVRSLSLPWYDGARPAFRQLAGNLYLACAMARIKYLRSPDPVPLIATDLAAYHKKWYNSALGAANPAANIPAFAYAIEQLTQEKSNV